MRKIKFRAWNIDQMHYDDSAEGFHMTNLYDTVMQFTGLKDCTGKDIYEGDIISVKGHTHEDTFTATVTYKRGGFWLDRDFIGNWKEYMLEVIGNVYEKG